MPYNYQFDDDPHEQPLFQNSLAVVSWRLGTSALNVASWDGASSHVLVSTLLVEYSGVAEGQNQLVELHDLKT